MGNKLSVDKVSMHLWVVCVFLIAALAAPAPAHALTPEEVLVVANGRAEKSVALARFYLSTRNIPDSNLLVVKTTPGESCARAVYNADIAAPVRRFLQKPSNARIRCIVLMYGMPLKILDDNKENKIQLKRLKQILKDTEQKLSRLHRTETIQRSSLERKISTLKRQMKRLRMSTNRAAVDSEMALVGAGSYPLANWVLNPYFVGYGGRKVSMDKKDVLMVSRIDGPTPDTVVKIIRDSLWAEKNGLRGTAYFDARWPAAEKRKLRGYQLYDNSLHRIARLLMQHKVMPVKLDSRQALFGPGQAPSAALYCGWYSLARYVDAFTWNRGAVGYHIASAECRTLKQPDSEVWCKKMLEKGVAATLGPVNEPYVEAFPLPEIFFAFLVDGYLTLAECYQASTPFLSWQMVLIGDPLYRPFYFQRGRYNLFPAKTKTKSS